MATRNDGCGAAPRRRSEESAMERFYYSRGKKVRLQEEDGVIAVKIAPSDRAGRRASAHEFGTPALGAEHGEPVAVLAGEDAAAFNRAGWVFVRPSSDVRRAFAARGVPEGATSAGRV